MMKPEKRSITIAGHATSVSLEPVFWDVLKEMAAESGQSVPNLIRQLDAEARAASLSSTLRVAALRWVQNR
ncbi:ribbon-helix-helix domain-containing protein [Alphaproteobacteria bacterium]|jgi:predicted DNA-binding ribbon-helix-helix protein|nr:ribbon-helix-helix domain-containing protein [Alphaproteobacteria bacterium]MDA8545117.1 ribbon-helix-helix domain-containing protein [Alphaproteobacteria bacterium]MDA8624362.1 ribbon-helix-helix domain-containing protein [Alphaproteobacteria bacterium]MDA8624761.1 ribbon-helix-helix domain-containing protein [Alphaproteobacteria bacterium]MDA8776648.1 ribbon-helix-helix domain-containing protein [Alphaproteobacteria bacterium]